MAKKIDKGADDVEAGIRFHMSSARMNMAKMSYVAFQRYLDRLERSMFRCAQCGWGGPGRQLVPMELGSEPSYFAEQQSDSWYACPRCEAPIDHEAPVVRPAD
jgi:rubrerythrin